MKIKLGRLPFSNIALHPTLFATKSAFSVDRLLSLSLSHSNLSRPHIDQAGIHGVDDSIWRANLQPLGETTLEDFLAQTDVDPTALICHQPGWLPQQQQMIVMDTNFLTSESVCENPSGTMPLQGVSSGGRKDRCPNEMMEKTIERRQKRMIKNRESAARSRAKKQAYTSKLELEVKHLRERNTWLKIQQETEMKLSSDLTTEIKYQLRRTSSAPF